MRGYQHTQPGYVVLALIGIGSLVLLTITTAGGVSKEYLFIGLLLSLVVLLLFAWLTTMVRGGVLYVSFGIGLIQRAVHVSEIQTCSVVQNPWYYGVGIHLTPHGWLYNVSGARAVEVTLTSGRAFRVGTDEPEELYQALWARYQSAQPDIGLNDSVRGGVQRTVNPGAPKKGCGSEGGFEARGLSPTRTPFPPQNWPRSSTCPATSSSVWDA
jgi:hypothetical protein